ncbi:hypothetical protein IWW34DRAFT_795332 [Fusarium oxysporum f. sp. albedinis]|nr:hypothetical protein IWW34DRAFT_795332 [Fusarium oxysporum f. sp. albedinis]
MRCLVSPRPTSEVQVPHRGARLLGPDHGQPNQRPISSSPGPPKSVRKAIHSIVIPRLLYGSEPWGPRHTRPAAERINGIRQRVSDGLPDQPRNMQVNIAARGCIPVEKTTPVAALQ